VCVCVCVSYEPKSKERIFPTQCHLIGLCILRSGHFCAARNEDRVLGTVTVLLDGRSKNLDANPGRDRNVSFFQNDQTGSRTHIASCSVGTGNVPPGQSDWGVKLTIHHIYCPY